MKLNEYFINKINKIFSFLHLIRFIDKIILIFNLSVKCSDLSVMPLFPGLLFPPFIILSTAPPKNLFSILHLSDLLNKLGLQNNTNHPTLGSTNLPLLKITMNKSNYLKISGGGNAHRCQFGKFIHFLNKKVPKMEYPMHFLNAIRSRHKKLIKPYKIWKIFHCLKLFTFYLNVCLAIKHYTINQKIHIHHLKFLFLLL